MEVPASRERARRNELALAIAEELDSASSSHGELSFADWSARLPVPNIGPLDFGRFPFQREWYSDEIVFARQVAMMKGTQLGASEYFVRWSLYFPDRYGDRALYVFPSSRQLRDFSDERVLPLVNSEFLRARIPGGSINNKMLKDVGQGKWFARGSQKAPDLDSIPASVLCLDEYDDLLPSSIPRAEKRLSSPLSRGLTRRFGVPRYSETGIHAEYEKSDQRRWLVTCGHCGSELPIHFYPQEEVHHFVDTEQCARVCGNCESPLKEEWIAGGRWVPLHPDRDYIGYHVHRLIVPLVNIPEIVAESKRTREFEVQEFWNSSLGLPYDPAEGRLSRTALAAATRGYFIGEWDDGYGGGNLVTAGVDVASARSLHVRVSEHTSEYDKVALYIGEVGSFDELAVMMDAYRVKLMLIDHLPDGRLARAMVNRFPGRCYTVSWADTRTDILAVDEQRGRVTVRRTEAISATLDMIREQKNLLPENLPDDYARHMRAAVKRRVEDDRGRVRVYYETREGHDYLQAESYDLVATEVFWHNLARDEIKRETLVRLEDVMPFERSGLGSAPGHQDSLEYATWPFEMEPPEEEDDDEEFREPYWPF